MTKEMLQAERSLADSRRERLKQRVHPNRIEDGLVANALAKVAVDLQGMGEALQRPTAVAGEAPVAGKIVMEDRFARVDGDGVLKSADRFFELADALEAPTEGHGDMNVVRDQLQTAAEREDCFAVALELAPRSAHQIAAAGDAEGVLPSAFERPQDLVQFPHLQVPF